MDEKKTLFIYTSIGYILAIFIYFLLFHKYDIRTIFSDLLLDEYSGVLTLKKDILYSENIYFNVEVSKKYRMLYRYWEAPLTYRENLDEPFIKLLDINSDQIAYVKDDEGNVYLTVDDERLKEFVKLKAFSSEVGIINLNYFNKGSYNLEVFYNIYPPIQTDGKFSHLNLKFLSRDHIPIKKITLKIDDPDNLIVDIYPHIPDFKVEKTDYGYLIEGKAIGGIVETEFLLKPFQFNGFTFYEDNIEGKTKGSNRFYSLFLSFKNLLKNLLTILVFTFPIWLYFLYKKYGEEKFFTVPQFLHYIPNKKREPFEVNLFFYGDAVKSDINGFLATLLKLAKKKYINIEKEEHF